MSALEAVDSNATKTALSPESALTGLFERHGDRIFGFCLRRLGSRPEAEDACQNTFLYAFRALQRGVRPMSETAWLFKIAENACLAAHRTNGRRRAREADHDPDLAGAVSAGVDESGTVAALRAALDKLPPSQRQALLLREWRGLSYREIASELGLTVAAVETLIFRARRSVARTLSRDTGIRGRLAGVLDLGSLVGTALKSALGGSAAAKLAAAAAVVTLATLPAGDAPLQSSPPAPDKTAAPLRQSSAGAGGRLGAARPATRTGSRDAARVAPAAGKSSRSTNDGAKKDAHPAPPGGPGGSGGPGAAGAPPAANAPDVPALPREVDVPAPPKVELPALPEPLPQLPQLPQLPPVSALEPPQVPALPGVPAVPEHPTDLLQPPK